MSEANSQMPDEKEEKKQMVPISSLPLVPTNSHADPPSNSPKEAKETHDLEDPISAESSQEKTKENKGTSPAKEKTKEESIDSKETEETKETAAAESYQEQNKEGSPAISLCHYCKTEQGTNACSACKAVFYCSVGCQRKDWKDHKAACCFVSAKQKQREEEKAEERRKEALKTKIGDFKMEEVVGTGNFSEIYKAVDRRNDQPRAIKVINKMRVKQLRKEKDVLMEKHCLLRLANNPFVPCLYDTFTDDLSLYIVTDLVDGGELWNLIKGFGLFQISLVRYFMASILKAVESCHALGIVHRDLKPENILLTKDRQIRLIDFGTARDLQHPEIKGAGNGSTPRRVYEHYIGTPNYMAPECIRNKDSNMKSDVYSLGSVFFQLFTGFPAFTGPSEYLIFKMSLEQKPPKIVGVIPEEVYELICLMTEKDFTKRISIEEIKRHPFFEEVDFEKNLSFEEAAKSFRPVEKLLTEIKEEVLQSSKLKKEELEAAISKTISSKIKEANSLEEKEKKEFEDRLRFLRRQLKHFYEIEEIEFFKF